MDLSSTIEEKKQRLEELRRLREKRRSYFFLVVRNRLGESELILILKRLTALLSRF